jgi:apolipoprotein N-acyltransferase
MKLLKTYRWLSLILTACVFILSQPVGIELCTFLVAGCAIACFWGSLLSFKKRLHRFLVAFFWYGSVLAFQLSWVATPDYHGSYIFIFYAFMLVFLALEFAFLSILLPIKRTIKTIDAFFLASIWVLMELFRLGILSGFSFNPMGLALTSNVLSLQFASIGGIYLLSFWVILLNAFFLRWVQSPRKYLFFVVFASIPFLYGAIQVYYQTERASTRSIQVLLVQTALSPGQKMGFSIDPKPPVHPLLQWRDIFLQLSPYQSSDIDLIVLPEGALPIEVHSDVYEFKDVNLLFQQIFNTQLQPKVGKLSNAYIAQALANLFQADLIAGFELAKNQNYYNSLLLFSSKKSPQSYSKTILVPMGEAIPFEWAKPLVAKYGIEDSWSRGKGPHILWGVCAYLPTVCYEDTFGNYVRKFRPKAELIVNVTNDVWFPHSTLPFEHQKLARLRTVENGLPMVRSTNTGGTVAWDCLGRVLVELPVYKSNKEWFSGCVQVDVPLSSYFTLFNFFGNWGIGGISVMNIFITALFYRKKVTSNEVLL